MVIIRLKLVIFDMDGLMIDTEQLYFRAFSDICISHGLEPQREIYTRTVGADNDNEMRIYKEAFPQLDISAFYNEVQERGIELISDGCLPVKPGLFELFDAIENRSGIKKAVVTSNTGDVAVDLLTKTGIMTYLDGGVYREMVTKGKPNPDSHLLCCQMFNIKPADGLVLEDSEVGILAALNAGIPVINIPDLVEPSADILSQCLARFDSLKDVIPFLDIYCDQY